MSSPTEPAAAPASAPWWTVIGLYDPTGNEFLPAATLPGRHECADSGTYSGQRFTRMAHHVQAGTAADAEVQVIAEVEGHD